MKPISFVPCLLLAGACGAPSGGAGDGSDATVAELRAALPTRAALALAPAATLPATP